jgi:hypothetical protein
MDAFTIRDLTRASAQLFTGFSDHAHVAWNLNPAAALRP